VYGVKRFKYSSKVFAFLLVAFVVVYSYSYFYEQYETQSVSDVYTPETAKYGVVTYTAEEIEELLASVEINYEGEIYPYDRDKYEKPVKKFEYAGESVSIRDYALHIYTGKDEVRDTYDLGFVDPYTGEVLDHEDEVEYDHIIPLNYANQNGAYFWDDELKNAFAFDLSVGVPTSKSENRKKGDKGPSKYLPPVNQEEYCLTWLVIAEKYDLSLYDEDVEVIKSVLEGASEVSVINYWPQ